MTQKNPNTKKQDSKSIFFSTKKNLALSVPTMGKEVIRFSGRHPKCKYKFDIPSGFPGNNFVFEYACIPVSIIMGRLHRLHLKEQNSEWSKLWLICRHLHSLDLNLAKSAGNQLDSLYTDLQDKIGLQESENYKIAANLSKM